MHKNDARVTFDGEVLRDIGDLIEGDGLSVAVQYSARSVSRVGAPSALIREFGNTQASFELPCVEYADTVDQAYSRQAQLLERWKSNKVAPLEVGRVLYPSASLTSFTCAVGMSVTRKPVVRMTYSFIVSYD